MEKIELEKLILKEIKEERFSDLLTNLEIVNFIIGELNSSSFLIKLRKELLESKEDFNFNDIVITNLILCIYSSALTVSLEEIIKIEEIVLKEEEHEEKIIEYLNTELDICLKQKEFIEKIKKSMNIIIKPSLFNKFEDSLILENEKIIKLINYIRIKQMVKIIMTGRRVKE